MCGINGIFAYHYAANPIDRAELVRTRDHMAPRGPDGAGDWIASDQRVGFGHRRLSIIDLSDTGAQPMTSADGRFVITFNGEIYNYRDLRSRLMQRGYAFTSQSDTEVLLHLYADRGAEMVHDLRGMFAFAIWDMRDRTLFLARDPYGVKPLYYCDDGWTFRFASQVKALLAGHAISRDPEPAGQVGFYLWGSVPEPFTTYRAVRALAAGETMMVDAIGTRTPTRYHSIAQVYCDGADAGKAGVVASARKVQFEMRDALLDSVRHHLVADVPVGAFLSAGVDSGALVGLMRDAGQQDIQTVTLAFAEFRDRPDDEAPLAEDVARQYGTRHTTRVVTETEFQDDLPRILEAMDQPTIDGINTWFVSKAARELGLKVAVSGLGGDELLGGYPSFHDVPRWVDYLAVPARIPGLGRAVRSLGGRISASLGTSPKAAGMLEYGGTYAGAYLLRRGLFMPWELADILDVETVQQGLRRLAPLARIDAALEPDPRFRHSRVATLESSFYMRNQLLRDTDWASMAHGLEVRVPLVDAVLLRRTAKHQGAICDRSSAPKAILALSPSQPLPATITARAKTGFTTPIERWLRTTSLKSAGVQVGSKAAPRSSHWSRQWAECLAAV
ncbi:MAG: asparagine synthase (glutamine-hydrolyzing) [Pseudomonadota bacterium]